MFSEKKYFAQFYKISEKAESSSVSIDLLIMV